MAGRHGRRSGSVELTLGIGRPAKDAGDVGQLLDDLGGDQEGVLAVDGVEVLANQSLYNVSRDTAQDCRLQQVTASAGLVGIVGCCGPAALLLSNLCCRRCHAHAHA